MNSLGLAKYALPNQALSDWLDVADTRHGGLKDSIQTELAAWPIVAKAGSISHHKCDGSWNCVI
jgi:hypothetical protein